MRGLLILGAGGNCLDAAEAARELEPGSTIGFLDDDLRAGAIIGGFRTYGKIEGATGFEVAHFLNAIGSPSSYQAKPEITERAGGDRIAWANVVHRTAWVSRSAQLGKGVLILSGVTVASEARIGDHVAILPNSVISHHAELEDHVIVAGGVNVASSVKIQRNAYIGAGASIREGVTIGEKALVGMGSVVLEDVAPGSVVVGCPARPLERVQPAQGV
ncbi:MAG: acetyltransferase [Gammaproteobacteria bacterium]|nr:acetyltransferase [Gammaproteobacteria bacterium]